MSNTPAENTGSNDLFKQLLEHSPFVAWMIDPDFVLKAYNTAFYEWMKKIYHVEVFVGCNILELPYTDKPDALLQWVPRYIATADSREAQRFIERVSYEHDKIYALDVTMTPVIANGELLGISVYARNATTSEEAQRILKNSEGEFRVLVEEADAIFWIRNKEKIYYVNKAFERIFGRPREELYKESDRLMDWVHPEDKPIALRAMTREGLLAIDALKENMRIIRPDGEVRWLSVRVMPIGGPDAKHRGYVLGIADDITEIKRIEDEHRQADHRFQSVIESADEMIFSLDTNFCYTAFNKKHTSVLEHLFNSRIAIGDHIFHVAPQFAAPMSIGLEKAKNGRRNAEEYTFGKGLTSIHFEVSFNPIFDMQGAVQGISVFTRDVTMRRKQERRNQKMTQLLASINKNIKEAIFRSSPDHLIKYVNSSFLEIFGYDSRDEVLNRKAYEFYKNPDERNEVVRILLAHKNISNKEVEFVKKDGTSFWGLLSSSMVEGDEGEIYFDGAIRDVTKQKEAQRQLEASNEELKRANQALDRFVYSASHDLKAPLASIGGLIRIFRMETDDSRKEQYLSMMEKSVHKLEGFIKDIVYYSRNARLEVKPEEIDLAAFVGDLIEDLKYAKQASKVRVEVDIEQNTPLKIDKTRLEAIMRNLISNGINYSDANKPDAFVRVEAKVSPNWLSIAISDNGIGIKEEHLGKIFDMFYRISSQGDGSGIGLYIVKEALEKLQGTIEVSSVFEKGTTFRIEVPNYGDL